MTTEAHAVTSRRAYYLVFLALIILTCTTVALDYVELGRFNLIIALIIAVIKATLVVMIFMQVRTSSALTKIFVVAGLLWVFLLILFTFSDYASRGWLPVPKSWSDTSKEDVLR